MTSITRQDQEVSINHLCIALSAQVNELRLVNVTLEGSADSLYELSRIIRGHPYLKSIYMKHVKLSAKNVNLDGLVCTIFATVQHLESIHLERVRGVSPSALAAVSHSHSLKLSYFGAVNMHLDDNTGPMVISALTSFCSKNNVTNVTVDLSRNHLSEKVVNTVEAALQDHENVTSIKLQDMTDAPAAIKKKSTAPRRGTAAHAA